MAATHEDVVNYCPTCHCTIKTKRAWAEHLKTVKHARSSGQPRPPGPQCQFCGFEFTKQESRKRHEQSTCLRRPASESLLMFSRDSSDTHWTPYSSAKRHRIEDEDERILSTMLNPPSRDYSKSTKSIDTIRSPDLGEGLETDRVWALGLDSNQDCYVAFVEEEKLDDDFWNMGPPSTFPDAAELIPDPFVNETPSINVEPHESASNSGDRDVDVDVDDGSVSQPGTSVPTVADDANTSLPAINARPPKFRRSECRELIGASKKDKPKCPLCRLEIPPGNEAILAHFKSHLDPEDTSEKMCNACGIVFPEKKDLDRHLQAVQSTSKCGSQFDHADGPCTGHHPFRNYGMDHHRFKEWCVVKWAQALLRKHLQAMQEFFDKQADLQSAGRNTVNSEAWSVGHGRKRSAFQRSLISANADVTVVASEPVLSLPTGQHTMQQTRSGFRERLRDHEFAHLLTDNGCKVQRDLDDAFIKACRWGSVALVKKLIDAGANIDHMAGPGFGTALITAVQQKGRQDLVTLLLERGANLDHVDEVLKTALIQAVDCNNPSLVTVLLWAGADTTIGYPYRGKPSLLEQLIAVGWYELALKVMSDTSKSTKRRAANDLYPKKARIRCYGPGTSMWKLWDSLVPFGPEDMQSLEEEQCSELDQGDFGLELMAFG